MKKHIYTLVNNLLVLMSMNLPAYAEEENIPLGEKLFTRCSACHLLDAQGVQGMFPPLVKRLGSLAASQSGRDYLVLTIDSGIMGPISIEGTNYTGVMPAQGPALGNDGIAAVINYLLENFNDESLPSRWKPFSAKEVTAIKKRYPNITNQDKKNMRQKLF